MSTTAIATREVGLDPSVERESVYPRQVEPPKTQTRRRKQNPHGKLYASHRYRQLIGAIVDDSGSMSNHGKCEAATEAVREMIYRARMKSPKQPAFDFMSLHFGDIVFAEQDHLLRPITEINEDSIRYRGDSGGTRIRPALECAESLLKTYEEQYYKLHPDPMGIPPALLFLLSDGQDGYKSPVEVARRITSDKLSICAPPVLVTIGIEYGGGDPNVELLQDIASKTTDGEPLYFDISNLGQLIEMIATVGSSGASDPDEILLIARQTEI